MQALYQLSYSPVIPAALRFPAATGPTLHVPGPRLPISSAASYLRRFADSTAAASITPRTPRVVAKKAWPETGAGAG